MGPSDQENTGEKDFMGLGRDIATCTEARKHVYAGSHMHGKTKHMYMDNRMYNVDPHVSSQHYADTIATVKSNILDAVQRPHVSALRWLYNNSSSLQANGSFAFAGNFRALKCKKSSFVEANVTVSGMGHPDWNYPAGRQNYFSFNSSQEQRGMEKVNDAYQIMHARGHGNALNCNLPANFLPDLSVSGMKVFPFVAPVLHKHTSTMNAHPIPTAVGQVLTPSLLVAGGPPTRMAPSESSIKLNSTQLTIFYGGKVNVYNDVSSTKAQEIMLMAAAGNSLPLNMDIPPVTGSLKISDPLQLSQIDLSACQSDQLARNQVGIGPLPDSISQALKAEESSMPGTQSPYLDDEPAFPRALPQARKASLARFLERRKERVASKSPYLMEKTFL